MNRGILRPPLVAESLALVASAEETFEVARRVARASADPLDAAPLLRKAFALLQLALLRLDVDRDGVTVAACAEGIAASPELAGAFAEVREPLACLEEVPRWATAPAELRRAANAASERLRESFSPLRRRVRRHIVVRSRAAGDPSRARRLVAMTGAVVMVGLLGLGVSVLIPKLPQPTEPSPGAQPAPVSNAGKPLRWGVATEVEVAPGVASDPRRCFRGSYYAGRDFEELLATRRDCVIDFLWSEAVPGIPHLPEDRFSVSWEAILRVPKSATYRFILGSDDGSRLYLNDGLLIDNWGTHGYFERWSPPVALEAGVDYRLAVAYFDEESLALVRLGWAAGDEAPRILSGAFVTPPSDPAPE